MLKNILAAYVYLVLMHVNDSFADNIIVPDLYKNIAAMHAVSAEKLYNEAMEVAGTNSTQLSLVVWPWTVHVNGHRYQFKDRMAMFTWLVHQQLEGDKSIITFGLDKNPLERQHRKQLWAEMDVTAMINRLAVTLKPKQQIKSNIPVQTHNTSNNLQKMIMQVAYEVGIDPSLIQAVVSQESAGKTNATSNKGAMGLMQLMPATARSLGLTPKQFYDPYSNLLGGATYLKQQLDEFGTVELALAAYNAGPGAVRKYGGIPPYRETRHYVAIISSRYDTLRKQAYKPKANQLLAQVKGMEAVF